MNPEVDERRESAKRWLNLESRETNWLIIGAVAIAALVVVIGVRSLRSGDAGQMTEREWRNLQETATLAIDSGRLDEAAAAAEQALALAVANYSEPNPAIAESCRRLGSIYMLAGEYAAAEAVAARAAENYVALLGQGNLETAAVMREYGMILARRGRFTESLPLLEGAIRACEQLAGPDAEATAAALQDLAEMRLLERRPAKATPLFERALTIRTKTAGPAGFATAETMAGLAAAVAREATASNAVDETTTEAAMKKATHLLERSLLIQQRAAGNSDRQVAPTLLRLAAVQQSQQQLEDAEVTALEALAIYEARYGPRHPETALALRQIATLAEDRGDLQLAQQCLDRAAVICNNSFGLGHPATIEALDQLIGVLIARDDYKTAEKPCRARLKGLQQAQPPDDAAVGQAMEQLAKVLEQTGQADEAKALRQRIAPSAASSQAAAAGQPDRGE